MNRLPEPRGLAVAIVVALVSLASASGQNAHSLKVMISGVFRAAYQDLVPGFEREDCPSLVNIPKAATAAACALISEA
jgi:hypothetical protein